MLFCNCYKIVTMFSITPKSNPETCQVFLLDRIAYWIAAMNQMQQHRQWISQKDTIILYYYSIFSPSDGAWFTFWSRSPEARNGTSDVPTPRPPFLVRYRVRQNLEKSTLSPILTLPKIIKHTFKMPLSPYKIRL